MKLLRHYRVAALLLLLAGALPVVDSRTSKLDSGQAYRQASSRPVTSEVVFSNEEESLLRGQQGDPAHMIAARLPGKTPVDVQKRCIELGLRCGGDANAPARFSENWRKSRRDRS